MSAPFASIKKKIGFISNQYFSRSGIKDLRAEPKHFNYL